MKIYIDSNVFVSNICEDEDDHEQSKEFFEFILKNNFKEEVSFITSIFTEVEVASAVFRRTGNEEKAQATLYKIENPWKEKIALLPYDLEKKIKLNDLVVKLVQTALRHGTTFGDTVHANDVESYDIDFLVTWNIRDFKKMEEKIGKLKVVTPTQILTELKKMIQNEDK